MVGRDVDREAQADALLRQTLNITFQWYQQADTKAQTILGFTGIFLSILAAPMLAGGRGSVSLSLLGSALLLLTIIAATLGIALSVAALWSRGMFAQHDPGIHFFGHIAEISKASDLRDAILQTTVRGHLDGLANEVLILSKNTKRKHRLVDLAAVSSGLALISLVLLMVSVLPI